jgi:ElaB protein
MFNLKEKQMSDVNQSPGVPNLSSFIPSTSSASSPDAAGATTATQSTGAGRTEVSEKTNHSKSPDAWSAVVAGEDATSVVGARVALIRDKLSDAQNVVKDRYRAVSESTDDFAHENPWKAIAIAALAGVIVGMLAAR